MLIFTFNLFLKISHTSYQWLRVRFTFTLEPFFNPLFDENEALLDNFDLEGTCFFTGTSFLDGDEDSFVADFFSNLIWFAAFW